MEAQESLQQVSQSFGLGEIKELARLEDGIVNRSYKIRTLKGNFVLQCLSPIFNEKVIEDYEKFQSYLRTNGIFVPVLLKNKDHKAFTKQGDAIWRVFEYIAHDQQDSINPSIKTAYEAGKILGKFHKIMSKSNFKPSFQLPGFHDTKNIINKLECLMHSKKNNIKSNAVNEEFNFIRNHINLSPDIGKMRKTIIHADPKIANFLFKEDKAIAILDLDTLMIASPLIDLGDALRSWCRVKPATSLFRQEIFRAALEGYNSESPFEYSQKEAKDAMSLLTLELAARYLNDYFEENYFIFKSEKYKTRAEQNLTRCRRYLEYFENFS
ncbi:MAG: phosphotransferase [Nanoarchaeota archaeon]|nr:phosphotransferase [Nanoarchaeota archaeon]